MIKAKPEKNSKHHLPPDGYKFSKPSRVDLCANSKATNDLIDLVTSDYFASRPKKLPRPQQELYRNHFEIILLDLFSTYLVSKVIWIGYSRGKSEFLKGGRYYNPLNEKSTISKTAYLNSIDYLTTINWIENWIAPAGYSRESSRMRAKSKLTRLFLEYGLNWTSIKTNITYPSIIVKDENKKIIPYPNTKGFDLEVALCNIDEINKTLSDTSVNLAISDNDFFEKWMMYDVEDLPSYLDRSEFFTEYNKSLLKAFSKAKIDIDFIDYICDNPRRALTPLGFYTAIVLYTNGYLEASQNKIKSFDLSKAVHDYVSLFNIGLELKRKEDAYQVRYRKMIDKPEMVLESEFNYSLLNAIFFEKVGAFVGSKELIIGNLLVTKFVSTPYLSNSGKSKDHEVVFNWLSESGKLNVIDKSSRYENNRRNQSEA